MRSPWYVLIGLCCTWPAFAQDAQWMVPVSTVAMRSAPDGTSAIVAQFTPDDVLLVQEGKDWCQVEDGLGRTGHVPCAALRQFTDLADAELGPWMERAFRYEARVYRGQQQTRQRQDLQAEKTYGDSIKVRWPASFAASQFFPAYYCRTGDGAALVALMDVVAADPGSSEVPAAALGRALRCRPEACKDTLRGLDEADRASVSKAMSFALWLTYDEDDVGEVQERDRLQGLLDGFYVKEPPAAPRPRWSIAVSTVTMRTSPDSTSAIVARFTADDVLLVSAGKDHCFADDLDGHTGYVPCAAVQSFSSMDEASTVRWMQGAFAVQAQIGRSFFKAYVRRDLQAQRAWQDTLFAHDAAYHAAQQLLMTHWCRTGDASTLLAFMQAVGANPGSASEDPPMTLARAFQCRTEECKAVLKRLAPDEHNIVSGAISTGLHLTFSEKDPEAKEERDRLLRLLD